MLKIAKIKQFVSDHKMELLDTATEILGAVIEINHPKSANERFVDSILNDTLLGFRPTR